MIDVVVTYCNDKDKEWKNKCDYYLKEEGTTDRQATGEERYRDWDCFKYWFRGIEENCKWINKIFLIEACESQLPKWLDRNNPKLRIVYHDEFIPKELLPTFNAVTIELFINQIKDLSDNYVYCNDDFYFLNKVPSNMFFTEKGIPVYDDNEGPLVKYNDNILKGSDGTFYKILNNNMDFQLKLNGENAKSWGIDHLPTAHKKYFENTIMKLYYKEFLDSQKPSRFRHKDNLSLQVFTNLYRDSQRFLRNNIYYNSKYVTLKSNVDFNQYYNCDMVCFNDTEQLDNYELTKEKFTAFLGEKFPNKSSFEV